MPLSEHLVQSGRLSSFQPTFLLYAHTEIKAVDAGMAWLDNVHTRRLQPYKG